MTNNEFFDKTESLDDKYIAALNERTHWFTELKRQPKYSIIDYEATDRKGRKCWIELKTRKKDFETFFIEPKKWKELKDEYTMRNVLPLYINFIENEDTFYIWNLKPVFDGIMREPKLTEVDIDNTGYNEMQRVLRYELPVVGYGNKYIYTEGRYKKVI